MQSVEFPKIYYYAHFKIPRRNAYDAVIQSIGHRYKMMFISSYGNVNNNDCLLNI